MRMLDQPIWTKPGVTHFRYAHQKRNGPMPLEPEVAYVLV